MRAGFTKRRGGGASTGAYADLNLGYRSGDGHAAVSRNWETVLSSVGVPGKPLILPRMTHGDGLAHADALPEQSALSGQSDQKSLLEPENADAVWSQSNRHVLAVTMADCLTALIFDPYSGTVAAVHAGWRGTHAHILEKTLLALANGRNIRAEKTLVAFGPCLRRESLEVGAELADRLEAKFVSVRDGRYYYDLPAANRSQAMASGIPGGNLRDAGGDTLTDPERYFSYRRDGQASGRMAAFISLL
ncbi:MAG: polyphenol oxidase family protein [Fibrobacteria bacterium]